MGTQVELTNIVKDFPGLRALDGASLVAHEGTIHALLGENGAGKTTLMRILAGLLTAEAGEVRLNGRPARFANPRQAIQAGIGMVHQQFMLVPKLTVAENIALASAANGGLGLDLRAVARQVEALAARYSFEVDPGARIQDLSIGQRQRVEILKAFSHEVRVLILDEPTAALTPVEVEELFGSLRQMRQAGITVIFITHKLREALAISDRITVLRRGRSVATVAPAATSAEALAELMVGVRVTAQVRREPFDAGDGPPALAVEALTVRADGGHVAVRALDLAVRRGEILGLAGVEGNGQRELVEALAGVRPAEEGRLRLAGQELGRWDPRTLAARGLAVIPEDRHRDGLALHLSVRDNLAARRYRTPPWSRRGMLNIGQLKAAAAQAIEQAGIVCSSDRAPVRNLSGGNQQKVILARELVLQHPSVIICAQPTIGLDIKAMYYVWDQLVLQRNRGCGILLLSTDLDEILALSDRVGVIYRGRLVGLRDRAAVDMAWLAREMGGLSHEES